MLAGNEPALEVARQPIGAVRRLLVDRHTLARHVLHPAIVVNITEQQVAAFLPPHRAFGWPQRAPEALGQLLDGLGGGDNLVQFRREWLDPLGRLGLDASDAPRQRQAADRHCHP